jgi:hypothetical protein
MSQFSVVGCRLSVDGTVFGAPLATTEFALRFKNLGTSRQPATENWQQIGNRQPTTGNRKPEVAR